MRKRPALKLALTDPAPAQRRTFYILLAATIILSIIDLAITLHWSMQIGPEVEFNPIMAWLMNIHPALFVAYKLVIPAIYIPIVILASRKAFQACFLGDGLPVWF